MKIWIKLILILFVMVVPCSIFVNAENSVKDETTDNPKQLKIEVTNNYKKDDVIKLINLQVGLEYAIYNGKELLQTFTASNENETNMTCYIKQLGKNGGVLYIKIKKDGKEAETITVTYDAEPKTSPISKSNVKVTVTNNYGKPDVINFQNIEKKAIYRIYKNTKAQKPIDQFTAKSTTEKRTIQQLSATAGSIYITVEKSESSESEATKINYTAEKLPFISTKNITITNFHKAKDQIALKGLTKGNTYTIYRDDSLKNKIISFTATTKSKNVTVTQIGTKAGVVYVVVSKKGYQSSKPTKVAYSKEKLVAISSKNVKVTNNNNSKDKITFKGLTKGNTYTIFLDKKLKKKLVSFKAAAKTKTLTVKQVGQKAGNIYVVVRKSPYLQSSATKVSHLAERTPALSSNNVVVNNTKKQDTIKLSGLKKGTTYIIYKNAKKKTKLTSFKASTTTKTITVKQLGVNEGKLYILAQSPGLRPSLLTTVHYSKEISGEKIAYLTFDDGPSKNTIKILDTLKKYNIKATFFVNGRTDSQSKQLYKRIVAEGHSIGSHIYSHDYSEIYRNKTAFMNSFNKLQNYIKNLTGVNMEILRFPGGSNNQVSYKYGGKGLMKELTKEMKKQGYVYFDWNVDSTDASVALQSKSKIVSSVLNGSKGKKQVVILMHDAAYKTTTAQALPEIIEGLKKQGFQFDRITKTSYAPQFLK